MTRFALLLALTGLAVPALAADSDDDAISWGEDDLLEDEDEDKKPAKKGELPTRSGPKSMGDEPEEEFDLLSDDAEEAEPMEFLGDFNDDDADIDLGFGEPEEPTRKQASRPAVTGPGAITLDVAG